MNKKARGFTLIEILVTLGIIALLTTMAMIAVRYARERAKTAKAQSEVDRIFLAISMLANDTGQWPDHQAANLVSAAANNEVCGPDANGNDCATGLDDASSGLALDDPVTPFSGWSGPYMPRVPLDPWDNEYFFDTDYSVDIDGRPCACGGGGCVNAVVVGSYGPDGLGKPDSASPGAYGCDDIIKIVTK